MKPSIRKQYNEAYTEAKYQSYIDFIEKGSNLVYGFIAQQIKNILPNVVKIIKDYIPNIYCNGKLYILNNQLILKSSGLGK